jgi:hypothetical protein
MYFRCGGGISVPRHNTRGKSEMSGCGASVLLQQGGPGSASSYPSMGSYLDTIGSGVGQPKMGRGLANSATLAGLTPEKKKKPKNINFSL